MFLKKKKIVFYFFIFNLFIPPFLFSLVDKLSSCHLQRQPIFFWSKKEQEKEKEKEKEKERKRKKTKILVLGGRARAGGKGSKNTRRGIRFVEIEDSFL